MRKLFKIIQALLLVFNIKIINPPDPFIKDDNQIVEYDESELIGLTIDVEENFITGHYAISLIKEDLDYEVYTSLKFNNYTVKLTDNTLSGYFYKGNFEFSNLGRLTTDIIKVKFEFETEMTNLKTYEFEIIKREFGKTYKSVDYQGLPIIEDPYPTSYYYHGSFFKTKFSFRTFGLPFEMKRNIYHLLDIEDFYLYKADLGEDFMQTHSAKLLLKWSKNTFPRLNYDVSNEGYFINLEYVLDKDKYRFKIKDPLYVDKETHMMSNTSGDYFEETTHFYFPYSKYDELKEIKCILYLDDLGPNKMNVEHEFLYKSLYRPFGIQSDNYYYINSKEGA